MLVDTIGIFLAASLIFYGVLAGADFGVGILEIFFRDDERLISQAMAPVWEANHVWLILALVILFTGFPPAFAQFSIYYHIPLIFLMMAIVMRGCAFTFRHYDVVPDGAQAYYAWVFRASSLLATFVLGLIAGAIFINAPRAD